MKLRYYSLVISLALEEDAFLDACKSYQEVYDTPEIKADEAKSQEVRGLVALRRHATPLMLIIQSPLFSQALEMIASYVVLAKYDNEQSDMLYKLDADPAMKKVPLHQCVCRLFKASSDLY